MPANNRTVDLLVEAFDLNQRRKFELKNAAGDVVVDLYFKPITRADRKKAQSLAGTDEALDISTQMLCHMAELEDGTKERLDCYDAVFPPKPAAKGAKPKAAKAVAECRFSKEEDERLACYNGFADAIPKLPKS